MAELTLFSEPTLIYRKYASPVQKRSSVANAGALVSIMNMTAREQRMMPPNEAVEKLLEGSSI
jgi:hypothetical protein